jgi:hypothetical protein
MKYQLGSCHRLRVALAVGRKTDRLQGVTRRGALRTSCVHDTLTDMDYSHLNGKTLFYAAPANTHEDGRPTFHRAEKYGRLLVSGNVVGLEPVDDDSGWWIEISPKVIAKLRQNKEARPLTYLGRTVTPDFDFGIVR